MNKITQFHIDHGYYVKIKPLPKMIGCFATFPANRLMSQPEANRTYIVNTEPSCIEVFHIDYGSDIISKKIHSDKFSLRLLILEDILLQTVARKMSRNLILVDGTDEKSVFTLLDVMMSQEELDLEKELCLRFRELLSGKVEYDVDASIADSYKKVLECFENGGL